jgi:hypothetical protein
VTDVDRFAVDALLRRHGFRILERKEMMTAVWERGGQRYTQYKTLKTIPADEIDAALEAQRQFRNGLGCAE